jgi:hypothetical protein
MNNNIIQHIFRKKKKLWKHNQKQRVFCLTMTSMKCTKKTKIKKKKIKVTRNKITIF